ncbi:MAG: porin [Rhodoblastus sp.]
MESLPRDDVAAPSVTARGQPTLSKRATRAAAPEGKRGAACSIDRLRLSGRLLGAAVICSASPYPAFPMDTTSEARSPAVRFVGACGSATEGFFIVPGTATCVRFGGYARSDIAVSNTPNRIGLTNYDTQAATGVSISDIATGKGWLPSKFVPYQSRDAVGWSSLARLELDSRTPSPFGMLRAFIRVEMNFGAGATANGALPQSLTDGTLGTYGSSETAILDKGFVQFGGVTMGRAQSMFDFFAGKIGYTNIRGSDQVANLLAYTASIPGGLSASVSVEDSVSHRGPTPSVVTGLPVQNALVPTLIGTRLPDLVVNGALDSSWGRIQLSAAAHQLAAATWADAVQPAAVAMGSTRRFGFAGLGGLQFKLDAIAPGDEVWLQATFARGAIGYVSGSNLSLNNGVNTSTNYGVGLNRVSSGNGWHGGNDSDCVWTYSGTCDRSTAFAITAAAQHFWTPTISSSLTGSFYQVRYPQSALNPASGAVALGLSSFGIGVTNYKEIILTSGVRWNPAPKFEIGVEGIWQHGVTSRPVGLAPDPVLVFNGLPSFYSSANLFRGRLRAIRAF